MAILESVALWRVTTKREIPVFRAYRWLLVVGYLQVRTRYLVISLGIASWLFMSQESLESSSFRCSTTAKSLASTTTLCAGTGSPTRIGRGISGCPRYNAGTNVLRTSTWPFGIPSWNLIRPPGRTCKGGDATSIRAIVEQLYRFVHAHCIY